MSIGIFGAITLVGFGIVKILQRQGSEMVDVVPMIIDHAVWIAAGLLVAAVAGYVSLWALAARLYEAQDH